MSRPLRALTRLFAAVALPTLGCESLGAFDTSGEAAYCGRSVDARFVRTPPAEGGFERIRLRAELDPGALTTTPARLTTDDAADGPCAPLATLADAPVEVTPELVHDSLSLMTFEDGQAANVLGWVSSTCRGRMLAVVSLYAGGDRVDVRLLRPKDPSVEGDRDAFVRFLLDRSRSGCGY
ncbi:MAG: hypothetical protein FJ104_16655 [Deltaproteobacteria bacterium]|nr:hypothetical protein [Deltaproteobacteria bacterium]